jgi:hypothetical protein
VVLSTYDSHSRPILIWKQSAALLAAIKEYDANKWKAIGQKVGKPAKVRQVPIFSYAVFSRSPQTFEWTAQISIMWSRSTDNTRPASSMPKSILVENIDNVEHSLHLPGFSAIVPLYDTSFPLSVQRYTRTDFPTSFGPHRSSRQRLSAAEYTMASTQAGICFAIVTPIIVCVPLFAMRKALLSPWVVGSMIIRSTDCHLHAPY